MRRLLLLLALVAALVAPGVAGETTPREIYERLLAVKNDPRKAGDADKEALVAAAKAALAENAELFSKGEGLHWRGRVQRIAKADWKDAVASYVAHADAEPDSPLANDSLVLAAQLVHRPGW